MKHHSQAIPLQLSWLHVLIVLVLVACPALQAAEETPRFEGDPSLGANARKWAKEFITFAAGRYDIELDWTEVSIKYLDEIGDDLHRTYTTEQPAEELVSPIARALGSYIAEVYRIYYGGDWGWVELETGSYPGVRSEDGATFLPLKKALDRITSGEDPDLWEYFQLMSER